MKPEEDAYGHILWAYYNGKKSYEVVERDDGYIEANLSPETYFSIYEDWPIHQKKAMKRVKGKVLDIGCGAGRHSLYLQKNGFDFLGIDNSPLAIKVCKLRGLKRAEVNSLEEVNFQPDSFDTILMMGNNFGLFGDFNKAQEFLERFYNFTSSDAVFIAETLDPYKTDNPTHLEYHEYNRKKGRMSGQVRIRIRFGKYATPWFDYLFVSKEEMENILRGTGWEAREFIDSESAVYIALIEKIS